MIGPQARLLPDGRRLHLQHGPIDLIIEAFGPARAACYARATQRFLTILDRLVAELPDLRKPARAQTAFSDPVARRMAQAVAPYRDIFVTPMAAVAGSVADEILCAMMDAAPVPKAYVNNGGDIAFHLGAAETLVSQSAAGRITIAARDGARGLATSGWQGRSHSLGIADAVTVAAPSAAAADVAATLIANAVDLPGHPAITRRPARELSPDSDLGARQVTTHVGVLADGEVDTALDHGVGFARRLVDRGLIAQAVLVCQGQLRSVAAPLETPLTGAFADA